MRIESGLPTTIGLTAGSGITAVRDGETRLTQVAERLGVAVASLHAANPHITSDVVTARTDFVCRRP
jgi:hypothetical protein